MDDSWDHIVVGQGLAGSVLAGNLVRLGKRVLVIDTPRADSPSRVAAGLMTPMTGKRCTPGHRWDEVWPAARECYETLQHVLGRDFLTRRPAIRLLSAEEKPSPALTGHESELGNAFHSSVRGFRMPECGRLDVNGFLDSVLASLRERNAVLAESVHPPEVVPFDGGIRIPRLSLRAKHLTFCCGYSPRPNVWFPHLSFEPAKGELLTLRIPELGEERTFHHSVWLTPIGDDLYMAGATYDRQHIDTQPTTTGRNEILDRLARFLCGPVEVVGHVAGVRPVVTGRLPVIGVHPLHPSIGLINGLASKGALWAPFAVQSYLKHIDREGPLDSELDTATRADTGERVTDQAHNLIRAVAQPGSQVIDATAGNGHDTLFLSRLVGRTGSVVAIDNQRTAIDHAAGLLPAELRPQVRFEHACHSEMTRLIPSTSRGRIAAIMFNLGYLPGGDKTRITRPDTTQTAIESGFRLLQPGGILTVVAYPGHSGGQADTEAASAALKRTGGVWLQRDNIASAAGPSLLCVLKPKPPRGDG